MGVKKHYLLFGPMGEIWRYDCSVWRMLVNYHAELPIATRRDTMHLVRTPWRKNVEALYRFLLSYYPVGQIGDLRYAKLANPKQDVHLRDLLGGRSKHHGNRTGNRRRGNNSRPA